MMQFFVSYLPWQNLFQLIELKWNKAKQKKCIAWNFFKNDTLKLVIFSLVSKYEWISEYSAFKLNNELIQVKIVTGENQNL